MNTVHKFEQILYNTDIYMMLILINLIIAFFYKDEIFWIFILLQKLKNIMHLYYVILKILFIEN